MTFNLRIPTPSGEIDFSIEAGSSAIFVGANGGGKTRLAAYIEEALGLSAHRIAAHRALTLNPAVPKITEENAQRGLRVGNENRAMGLGHRVGYRWQGNSSTALLNDFDYLIQVLFADQAKHALETHNRVRRGDMGPADPTKFERLAAVWDRLLPHRELHISGDTIEVSIRGRDDRYNAADMSDGERAIFYMIGQALAGEANSVLIFDEPELHVHRSIMGKLWDEIEAARPDCALIFITHDLEFAASRIGQKFVIRDFDPAPGWTIEPVPENTGFDEEIATLILGSRRPILFVEGTNDSLDVAIYRCCYPDWTVIPRGSCEEVIHSVVTMRRNEQLTRVTCSGLVDADDYEQGDIDYLRDLGVAVLPVSEIENVILLPDVSRAIAETEAYEGAELEARLNVLKAAIFAAIGSAAAVEGVVARYCRRRIDRTLKKIDLSGAETIEAIATEYAEKTSGFDVRAVAEQASNRIARAVAEDNLPMLLANFDNKGLLAEAATHLKRQRRADFEGWLTRVLRNDKAPEVVAAIRNHLPQVHAA